MIKPDELVPLMILEWIKGDKIGTQEIIETVDIQGEFVWVNFHGGSRINGHVINEFMNLTGMASESDINKHLDSKNTEQEISSTKTPVSSEKNVNIPIQPPVPTNTFGFDILDKANRDSKMKLNLAIEFDFISEEKIQMLLELYGDDLFESLNKYVRQQLSEEVIEACIKQYLVYKFPDFGEVNKVEETSEV
jgi:hypothetical protein